MKKTKTSINSILQSIELNNEYQGKPNKDTSKIFYFGLEQGFTIYLF